MEETLLQDFHFKYGHPGEAKTLQTLSRDYYLPNFKQKIKSFIKRCEYCKECKSNNTQYGVLNGNLF